MTTNKGYIGLASRMARQGDVICILLGCDVPVILNLLKADQRIAGLENLIFMKLWRVKQ
jgi:hypothetical protein